MLCRFLRTVLKLEFSISYLEASEWGGILMRENEAFNGNWGWKGDAISHEYLNS
jgi:hypothetical protein